MLMTRKAKKRPVYIKKSDRQKERLKKLKEMLDRWSVPLSAKLIDLWHGQIFSITTEDILKVYTAYHVGRFVYENELSKQAEQAKAFTNTILSELMASSAAETYTDVVTDFPKVDTPVSQISYSNFVSSIDLSTFDVKINRNNFDNTSFNTFIDIPAIGNVPNVGLNFENIITKYIGEHTAEFVKDINTVQRKNIIEVISGLDNGRYNINTATRLIKNSIGLTERQFNASMKYYNSVRAELARNNPDLSPVEINTRASEMAYQYTERKRFERAETIARTEIVAAHNQSYDIYIREAQKQGLIGEVVLKWVSAREGVCEDCASLDGQVIELDGEFKTDLYFYGNQKHLPPVHPNCRCIVEYIEKGSPEAVPDTSWYDRLSDSEKKAFHNRAADREQWNRYKKVLGKENVPETLEEFQDLKYNNSVYYDYLKLDYSRQNRLKQNPELALPNAKQAMADDRKFTDYIFDQTKPKGYAKGNVFDSRLGYDINNYTELRDIILKSAPKYPVKLKGNNGHGDLYEQKIVLYGYKGTPANVVVGWINNDNGTKMTSAYIKEVK